MIAGLILAGGHGMRLGRVDKAFTLLAGRPLLAHALACLAPQAEHLAISANGDAARFAGYGLPVLSDGGDAGKGPLAGIAAGLAWAGSLGAESLLSLPVDTPFAPRDVAARLSPAPAVASWGGRQHHLVALWPVGFLPRLQAFLAVPGDHKVREAIRLAGARNVAFYTPTDPFLNINTPADLAEAELVAR